MISTAGSTPGLESGGRENLENPANPWSTRAIVELRQYRLKPGRRDALIQIFERHFVEPQEAAGMTLVGQFRDRRRPDRFVWLRAFPDMPARHAALEAFYGGRVWAAHGPAANDTMLAWDDVLLLRPARPGDGFRTRAPGPFSPERAAEGSTRSVLVGIYELARPAGDEVLRRFDRAIAPMLGANGMDIAALLVTEPSTNTFTRLPVREGVNALVWIATGPRHDPAPGWLEQLGALCVLDGRPVALLDLEPTSRSRLGDGARAARATAHDFDFLFGRWRVHHRCLNARLCRSNDWSGFEGSSEARPLPGGLGHVDAYSFVRHGRAIEGVALRLFDPATGCWSIHWADTSRPGRLLPPMTGQFQGPTGEFFGDEEVDGRLVRCRFRWTRAGLGAPQWEQAFSDDGGRTWETNWIMTFTRAD
jgi:hypothetical protein